MTHDPRHIAGPYATAALAHRGHTAIKLGWEKGKLGRSLPLFPCFPGFLLAPAALLLLGVDAWDGIILAYR